MPFLWKLLLRRFLLIFMLTLLGFIGFLIIFQLEELAKLAASGADLFNLSLFALLQIPYILPVAIAISTLASAFIVMRTLSRSGELTALRASGASISKTLAPLYALALFLVISNFLITSELATRAHMASRNLLVKLTSSNPLFLLENNRAATLRGGYVSLESIKKGERASNLLLCQLAPDSGRLALFLAKSLTLEEGSLTLDSAALLYPLKQEGLYLENVQKSEGSALQWAHLFRPQKFKYAADHLPFKMLLSEIATFKNGSSGKGERALGKIQIEIWRRVSFALAPFSFFLLGAIFGIEVGREKKIFPFLIMIGASSATVITFFIGKSVSQVSGAALLFFSPIC